MVQLERLPTHIDGFDDIVFGGFLSPGFYLLLGKPGTGKTIWMLTTAAKQIINANSSVFITIDQRKEVCENVTSIFANKEDISRLLTVDFYSWRLSKAGAVKISSLPNLTEAIIEGCERAKETGRRITYVFLDSLTTLIAYNRTENIYKFINHLRGVLEPYNCCFFASLDAGAQPVSEQILLEQVFDGTITFSREGQRRFFSIPRIFLTPPVYNVEFSIDPEQGFLVGEYFKEAGKGFEEADERDILNILRGTKI